MGSETGGWIAQVRNTVDERLGAYFAEKRREGGDISPDAETLVEAIETLTMRGGKRLRPAVLTAGWRAVAPADADLRVTAEPGAALELLQSYLLIHDDWMDQDDERRGGPSVHAALREHVSPPHLADSLAVLAGDLGCTYAWELILSTDWPHARRREAEEAFLQIQKEVLFGQQLDLTASPHVSRMHQLKTGSYTVRGPLRLGGILGGGNEQQLRALDDFGEPLGEAFQLRDDLLGTFGDTEATGKPAGNDLKAGKRTSLVAEAESSLGEDELAPLRGVLGNDGASADQIASATDLLERCGARERVEARLDTLLARAVAAIDAGDFTDEGRSQLRDVANKLAVRAM
ncbi:MAG: polyprenyl synthetase family protein [Polyangiales bacterium]